MKKITCATLTAAFLVCLFVCINATVESTTDAKVQSSVYKRVRSHGWPLSRLQVGSSLHPALAGV
jgi:hypothetical protein